MSYWQVLAIGEGFDRQGKLQGFELTGSISAENANAAYIKAIALAERDYPELRQAYSPNSPQAFINPEEIQELKELPVGNIDTVEMHWL
ncbi:MAG: hypothetical protein ACOY3E_08310 [Pseudomonadota bacterium]